MKKRGTPIKGRPCHERIKTVIRLRTGEEGNTNSDRVNKQYDSQQYQTYISENQIKITNEIEQTEYQFAFDRVFEPEVGQSAFYKESGVEGIIRQVLEGFNGFVFAYGQSGTGKTHTLGLQLQQREQGLILNSATTLFQLLAQRHQEFTDHSFDVHVGVPAVYCESIYDLLETQQN